jgi:hypothetical protein
MKKIVTLIILALTAASVYSKSAGRQAIAQLQAENPYLNQGFTGPLTDIPVSEKAPNGMLQAIKTNCVRFNRVDVSKPETVDHYIQHLRNTSWGSTTKDYMRVPITTVKGSFPDLVVWPLAYKCVTPEPGTRIFKYALCKDLKRFSGVIYTDSGRVVQDLAPRPHRNDRVYIGNVYIVEETWVLDGARGWVKKGLGYGEATLKLSRAHRKDIERSLADKGYIKF